MPYLLDTGILLRLFDRAHPDFAAIRGAVRILKSRQEQLYTTQQNIAEFWNVSTRPSTARGGLGLAAAKLPPRVMFIERLCALLGCGPAAYLGWKQLVVNYGVTGASVHDARIVAVMLAHNIPNILTLNPQDFRRYPSITVVEPIDILSSP
jgi:predicted nucleic acid-binding protein